MEQQQQQQQSSSHQPNSNLSLLPIQTSSFQSPKIIKPIIRTHSQRNHSDELHPQKSLKLYSKSSRQTKHSVNSKENAYGRSKAFTRILKAQSKPSNLHYFLGLSKHFENILLFSHLKNLSSVPSLFVSLSSRQEASLESLKVLQKNLPNLKNIATLEIRLQFLRLQDPQTLQRFLKSIRKMRSLTSLSFTIFNCKEISQVHFDSFFRHLSKLTHLQALKLTFDNSVNPKNNNILRNLISILPKLTLLTQISISFDELRAIFVFKISDLLKSLGHLKTLSDLTLSLKSLEIIPPLPSIFTHLTALPSLQKLRLHLHRNIDDQSLEALSQTLMSLPSLSLLSLNLIQCTDITDKGIDNLQLALSSLLTLSSLTMHLLFLLKTPLIISKVASALKPLHNLIKLDLMFKIDFPDLSIPGPSSNETQTLFTNLRFLKSLQYLELNLPTRNELEDDAFGILAESLKELVSLKNILLNPGFAKGLTNKGVEALSDALKSLINLSGLTVFFRSNKNIDEKTLNFLGSAILDHPALSSIKVTFKECSQVKSLKSFGTLFQAIKQMKDTSDVLLHIPDSENKGPEGEYLKGRNILKVSWLA